MPHAVSRLRSACLAHSPDRPRLDRGAPRKARCVRCRLAPSHCLCDLRPVAVPTRAAVCLIMGEFEPLKPTNTGWLIADVVADTTAFGWSRTAVDPALPALLADPKWQPYVVFPGEFADAARVVTELLPSGMDDRERASASGGGSAVRPLFVLLDGTWSEARKIFRKSPYLDRFPVLSLQPDQLKRYRLRRSSHAHHFCTSEVAALCLALAGDLHAAQVLEAYLDVFTRRYLQARQSLPPDPTDTAHAQLRALVGGPAAGGAAPCQPALDGLTSG